MDAGMRVVDVWESPEAFQAFAQERLAAAFQEAGATLPADMQPTAVWPVSGIMMVELCWFRLPCRSILQRKDLCMFFRSREHVRVFLCPIREVRSATADRQQQRPAHIMRRSQAPAAFPCVTHGVPQRRPPAASTRLRRAA